MPINNIKQQAFESFMRSTTKDEKSPSVVQAGDEPAVVGPPIFKVHHSKNQTFFDGPAFPQPTYEMVFLTSSILSPPKGGSTVQPVHPETSFPERVRKTVCDLVIRPIKVETFCSGLIGLGFPQSVVSALLMKMNLTRETNGNCMVDIKGMHENIDQFVKSLVQMKEIVDFVVAVITTLKKKPIHWTMFLNNTSHAYIDTTIPKEVLQSVRRCLTTMGFSEGNGLMNVPSNLASLSASQLLEHIWTIVSNYDWESAPQKPAKRGRDDDPPPNMANKRKFSPKELLKIVLSRLTSSLLVTHGLGEISLFKFFSTAFLDLSPEHLRQMMLFLENYDNIWRIHRILMEVPQLNVFFRNGDFYLSMGEGFMFLSFNLQEMLVHFDGLFLEAIMMHQMAAQERHEQEVREEQERQRVERFRTAILNRLKMRDTNQLFRELVAVCPEFNSFSTNLRLLEVVVDEFTNRIYNATTRAYHNREPCLDPLQVFIEYATVRGVFSPKAPVRECIRICEYSSKSCPYGPTCSGVHQCFFSSGWKKGSVWGTCCSEYSERRTCRNPDCRYGHFTGDEFNRAFTNGGKDSNKMRNDLIEQSENQLKRQRTSE